MSPRLPTSPLFPYTTLFRSLGARGSDRLQALAGRIADAGGEAAYARTDVRHRDDISNLVKVGCKRYGKLDVLVNNAALCPDRKSTRLNSSHRCISYAVFCLK